MCDLYIGAYLMESSYFDKVPETELIEKFNSPTTSRENSPPSWHTCGKNIRPS